MTAPERFAELSDSSCTAGTSIHDPSRSRSVRRSSRACWLQCPSQCPSNNHSTTTFELANACFLVLRWASARQKIKIARSAWMPLASASCKVESFKPTGARAMTSKLSFLTWCAAAGVMFLGGAFQASASPVDVTYTVTGSTGDWTYDFSFSNNLGGTNDLYAASVTLPSGTLSGSPSGWGNGLGALEWCYDANCYYTGTTNLPPGDTLGGFIVQSTATNALLNVDWYAAAYGGNLGNPTFTGTASAATPLPAALPLFATGLGALGLFGWRRKRKNSAALTAA